MVKSVAIVKHQVVQMPADFARLQCNTDLNIPPTNWLNSSINAYGLQQALSQSTGFSRCFILVRCILGNLHSFSELSSSFCMAHLFPDCVGEVDVVANAENIKRLLKLPYAPNSPISMMVHRIGNTLLIDEFDVQKYLLQQEDDEWKWLRSFIYETILSRLSDPERKTFVKSSQRPEASHQRSLLSKFLYHSLSRSDETPSQAEFTESDDFEYPKLRLAGPVLPEPSIEENLPDPEHTKHTYNRNVVWTFEDIRMLIGTDMAIFGGNSRPCISLRLRDMRQPINVLTGIDYWLDNLMCNVPEVVMCYHLDGLVQKYEIIKTEDLPDLEDSKFSPKVIRNVAQNILSFLKQNATKSGHTYWLFKGRNDDVVKLYDLTSLCANEGFESAEMSPEQPSSSDSATGKDENPFTVPVAMLLYRVARNMKNSAERINCRQAGSIKALLENCIKLLPKEKYPQIVTSSYYLLSDLHIPTDTNPRTPSFDDDNESDTTSVYDDEKFGDECGDGNGSNSNGDDYENSVNIAIKSIFDTASESNLAKNWKHNSSPPPLNGTAEERCDDALQLIVRGLSCLQYFTSNEEKLAKEREEISKQQEKTRIIQEEQNPNMAKSYQAIPLPYVQLSANAETSAKSAVAIPSQKKRKRTSSSTKKGGSQAIALSTGPVIQSWNMHLKLLLVEKACLIYATMVEQSYQQEQYGSALRYITLALKCQHIVAQHMSFVTSQKLCLLGRAGDCLVQCAQNFSEIQRFIDQFEAARDIDETIKEELKCDLEAIESEKQLQVCDSQEQLLLMSIECYQAALECVDGEESRNELIGRLGSVQNELGVKYMHWAQAEYTKTMKPTAEEAKSADGGEAESEDAPTEPIYMDLSKRSRICLTNGISAFEQIQDNMNLAVLLCNMGRFMRFRAHLHEEKERIDFKKRCYDSAFSYYQRAMNVLESKKRCPDLWDLVNWEMSTGKFTLGKHLLDTYFDTMASLISIPFLIPKMCSFSSVFQNEETEQVIIELLLNALKYCDTESAGSRQIMYIVRSGLIYHNLGNVYSKAYQREALSEARKKKLLQLCRLYYDKGVKVFEGCDAVSELLDIHSDRMELQHILFEGAPNNSQKKKLLKAALKIACDCSEHLRKIEQTEDLNADDVIEILKNFESQLQLALKNFIRLCMNSPPNTSLADSYKKVYAMTLQTAKDDMKYPRFAKHLANVLDNVKIC